MDNNAGAPMKPDDRHVAWLRAQVGGDEATMRRLIDELTDAGAMDPLAPLINRAFVIAVRDAFGDRFTRGEVIRLVANVRTLLSEAPVAIDPAVAESEIRRALGDPAPLSGDPDARATAQMAVLDYLVHDMELDEERTDALLSQALSQARETPGG